jgi:predicted Zn finger-like uncharacterized protein
MIVVCSICTTRLQLDDAKLPPRAFTVRCPKCQNIINAQPPVSTNAEAGALGVGDSPSLENPRYKQPNPAPAFNPDLAEVSEDVQAYAQPPAAAAVESNDVARALATFLQHAAPEKQGQPGAASRLSWERRRALVCVTAAHREALAHQLASSNYQVYIADDTTQAIERMREDRMDVVVLDPAFDPVEQGAAFVTREVSIMRPAERRRLFFVHLTSSARTLDAHAAFISNVNMVINPVDIESMSQVLERALRDFNELYREFNGALSVVTI